MDSYSSTSDRAQLGEPTGTPQPTRIATPLTVTTSPRTSCRPRRDSGSPLTRTWVSASNDFTSDPASITSASLRNCPSRMEPVEMATSRTQPSFREEVEVLRPGKAVSTYVAAVTAGPPTNRLQMIEARLAMIRGRASDLLLIGGPNVAESEPRLCSSGVNCHGRADPPPAFRRIGRRR